MAEINLYQYAEIKRPGSAPEIIGSKNKPTTITLTGTGELIHRVYNDITGPAVTSLYSSTLTGLKWFAVKASVDIVVGVGGTSDSGATTDTSAFKVPSNVWQFFNSGGTTIDGNGDNLDARVANNACNILKVNAYNLLDADIEFIAVY